MPSSACKNQIRSEEHTSELQSLRHLVCRLLLDNPIRSEEHTSELQSLRHLVCRLLLEENITDFGALSGLYAVVVGVFRGERARFIQNFIRHPDLAFFFNDTATTEIYPLSLHDALPI